MQYLYASGEAHVFMDNGTYEQIELGEKQIERELKFLKENMEVSIMTYQGEVLGVELQTQLNYKLQKQSRIKGDTASNVTKPATLETGLVVQVPIFINEGEMLIINTGEGKYVSRA